MEACAVAVFVQWNDANIIHRVWETLYPPHPPSMTTAWEAAGGDSPWTNCEIVHVSRSFWTRGQGWGGGGGGSDCWLLQLLSGSSCKFTHRAAFWHLTLPPAHKNGTKCFSLWNSLLAYRWRSHTALAPLHLTMGTPTPPHPTTSCSCDAFRRHPGTFPQWLFGEGRRKREGRCWDNTGQPSAAD